MDRRLLELAEMAVVSQIKALEAEHATIVGLLAATPKSLERITERLALQRFRPCF